MNLQTRLGWAVYALAAALAMGMNATPAPAASSPAVSSTAGAARAIRRVLETQVAAWNRGDIRAFMAGYWKSDQTEFVGAGGILRGWKKVLDRYLRTYPNRAAMGHLTFSNLEIHVLCRDAAYVLGKYHLKRAKDQPEGVFTLLFKKFPEGWRIIHDHTTAYPPAKATEKQSE